MIPKSFSASALQTAGLCLARYKAENVDRTPSISNSAADTGTAVHYALEHFVRFCVLENNKSGWRIELLEKCYQEGYTDTFHNSDFTSAEYEDGWNLCKIWFKRSTYVRDTDVISCEIKSNFPVPTSAGEIPLNYIWDRCDRIDEETVRVVDYKTIRRPVTASDLKIKIQPRVYALAAQIQFPEAKKIWVRFDLLRHDEVGRVFTREDNIATWKFLKREAQRIIDSSEIDPPETLNTECHFCIRKSACSALTENIKAGGIAGVTPADAARRRLTVQAQLKALKYLDEELDGILVAHAEKEDLLEMDFDDLHVKMKVSSRRSISDNTAVAEILGPEMAAKLGKFTLGDLDTLLKGDDLTDTQKKQIKQYIGKNFGQPTSEVTLKSPLEED